MNPLQRNVVFTVFLTMTFGSFIPQLASAASKYYNANVERILTDSENFGGCMAFVNPSPSDEGLDCSASWITFSCTGDFNSKSDAQSKVSAAQLALVTRGRVGIRVEDDRKHNGYCFARRIDNLD